MKEKRSRHLCVCVGVWEGEKMKLEEAGMCVSLCLCVIAEKALLSKKRQKQNKRKKKEHVCPLENESVKGERNTGLIGCLLLYL